MKLMKNLKHFLTVFMFALVAALLLSGSAAAQQPEDELEQRGRHFVELLAQGRFEDAAASYDATMLRVLPPAKLSAVWDDVLQQYGAFQQIVEARSAPANAYTMVNVHVQFEKALLNFRVVFDKDQRVAGLFYTPLEPVGRVSAGFLASLAFSAFFVVVYPLALAFWIWRRYGVSWLFFVYGLGVFIIFQLLMRIPMVQLVQTLFGAQIRSSTWLTGAWLVLLAFTAGLFEECGRYVGYRWIMPKDPKTWKVGMMYGVGHGGIESIVLVGLTQVTLLATLTLYPVVADFLPETLRGLLATQVAAMVGSPAWLPLLAAWERFWTVLFHMAMSLVVLQVFRRGRLSWLWLAIGLHTLLNLVVVALPSLAPLPRQSQQLLSEALAGLAGLLSVFGIWWFKLDEDRASLAGLSAPSAPPE